MFNLRLFIRNNRGFIAFLLAFGLIRTAVADYNPVPSGSMHPTILEGDVVLINRLAYDLKIPLTDIAVSHLGDPQRGDIVTFYSPKDRTRLIKRVIGLPGDTVAMHNKHVLINEQPASYVALDVTTEKVGAGHEIPALRLSEKLGDEYIGAKYIGDRPHRVQWLSGISSVDNFGPIIIPADQYLMLGDNRDNSADSRYIGLVPRSLLIGRAERILVSAAITENWMPRVERFGESLYR